MTRTGEDRMRFLVHLVCVLLGKSGLIGVISISYPTVATALVALQAACTATGFDKVPEIQR